jgi:hypothetical protein
MAIQFVTNAEDNCCFNGDHMGCAVITPQAMNRMGFLRNYGIASRALNLNPLFLERKTAVREATGIASRVNIWRNADWTGWEARCAAQSKLVAQEQYVKGLINLNTSGD